MAAKLPFIQWYPADWIAATTMLSPATRGIWFDILNVMWQMDRAEKITGTLAEIARAGRCDAVQMRTAIDELTTFHVADITERNDKVTVVCRRFKKANAERVRIREAVKKSRRNENVTPDIAEDRRHNIKTENLPFSVSPEPEKSGNPGKRTPEKIFFDYDGDARIHGITKQQLDLWKENFPAVDVDTELKSASAWLDGNRKNRKTDVKRFLVNWLKRQQDRAPRVAAEPPPSRRHGAGEGDWRV